MKFSSFLLFAALLLLGFLFIGVSETSAQPKAKSVPIKLYFWPKGDDTFEMSAAVEVTRKIKSTSRLADAAIRELLKGANSGEKARGLISFYTPDTIVIGGDCQSPKMKPLLDYFIGVSIRKGVATINFKEPGLCYMNTTAAMSAVVMGPINKTLLQFKSIKDVQVAINGKVFDEWDV